MPINEQGYIRPTYDDLLAGRIAKAKELFGEDIDTGNDTALGKFIRLAVQDLADAYEAQEIIYYSRFPNTATGQALDRLTPFAVISRNPATRAEHEITFTGTEGHTIEPGFLVGTTGGVTYYLANSLTLDEDGEGVGIVQCTELGTAGNVRLGAIVEIINPDANVLSIEHTGIVTIAEDEESDADLRKRFSVTLAGSGSGTAAAIRGAVMRVAGVKSCIIIENKGSTTDSGGRPPNSFEVFVHTPSSADPNMATAIGEAIFSKKPLGIPSHGTTTATVLDISGKEQTVKFSYVAEIGLTIRATVKKDSHFQVDGVEQIKTAIIEYIESLGSGEDVIFTRLYKSIFGIDGVKDVSSLTISGDGSAFVSANITIGPDEVAAISADDIEIEVVDYADQ